DLRALLSPHDLLRAFASSRGWGAVTLPAPVVPDGRTDTLDGATVVHAAFAAARGDVAEVDRRVWRAGGGGRCPFTEERRLPALPRVRGLLHLPVETTYGTVTEAEELEVGQLLHFLRGRSVRPPLWRLLNLLKDMRHALAHLRPVAINHLFADELLREV